jgi:class 3 adenylate cyclase/tetratricopeptide (TPR) repeat protein
VICTTCGTENAPGRKFCSNCGARLAVVCSNCGAANAPADRFCGECGTALVEGAVPAVAGPAATSTSGEQAAIAAESAGAQVAERRLVTVLFADLVGFTTYSESRDAEEVRELLGRYFESARQVIERYGGTVEKFIGDAVMAVWGTPVAREDDAERAVRAGLDLLDAVRALVPADAPEADRLHLRAGVLTGEAAVTVGAVGQGMVAGDLVNTASRLQSVAPPDTVLVGESTYRAGRGAITFEPVGEQQLKGKALPVPAWRAMHVVAMRGGGGRSDRLEAPFVGRDPELRLLKEQLHATGRERRLHVVSVTGIAGIGKSRLAWEFLKYIDGLVEDIYWHQGRSPAYGEGVTFWALGEMVRRRAAIAETDDEPTSREKLAATLAEFVPDEADRRWIGPRLEALLGLADPPTGEREETFAAWRAFFERVASQGPTVLVFEELHWADAGVLDFIESMVEWSRSHPILIVTLARPELLERRPTWGAGQRNFVALALEPLSDAAMRELLAGLAPGLPDPVVRRILERAEGVPLYAVETVRMLVDAGHLVEEEGSYRVVGDVTRLAVPETLQALIAARIDGLEPGERALLQDAAILGQSFTVAALAALTGRPEEALGEPLRSLVRKEVLVLDADPRSPERGQYGFVQGLIREVAHETISKRERRAKHLAAARYFETLGDEGLAGILASHYLQAHEATPAGPEADALAAQARVALRAAAERAAALYSHEQALAFLEQAEGVTIDPAERATLWERMGEAGRAAGRHEVAVARLEQAIAWHGERGDAAAVARDTARLGESLLRLAQVAPAIERLGAVDRAGLAAREAAMISAVLGRAYMLHGEYDRALPELERALVAAGEVGDVEIVAEALTSKGPVIGEMERLHEAIAVLHGAIALAESHGLVHTHARATYNLAGRLYQDDPAAAFRVLREGVERARRLGQRGWLVVLASFTVGAALDAGEWDWASTLAEEAFQGELSAADRIAAEAWIAQLDALRGRPDHAEAMLDELGPLLQGISNPGDVAVYWWARSNVAWGTGRFEEAHAAGLRAAEATPSDPGIGSGLAAAAALQLGDPERVRSGLEGMRRQPGRGRFVSTLRDEYAAALLAFDGQVAEATRRYADVIRRLRDLGNPLAAVIATVEAVLLFGRDDPAIRAAADEARAFATARGGQGLIERLDDAAVRGPIAASSARKPAKRVAEPAPAPGRP